MPRHVGSCFTPRLVCLWTFLRAASFIVKAEVSLKLVSCHLKASANGASPFTVPRFHTGLHHKQNVKWYSGSHFLLLIVFNDLLIMCYFTKLPWRWITCNSYLCFRTEENVSMQHSYKWKRKKYNCFGVRWQGCPNHLQQSWQNPL